MGGVLNMIPLQTTDGTATILQFNGTTTELHPTKHGSLKLEHWV